MGAALSSHERFSSTMKSSLHLKKIFSIVGLSVLGLFCLLIVIAAVMKPKVVSFNPSAKEGVALVSPVKIHFNLPVIRKNLEVKITPAIEGSWHSEGGVFGSHLSRTMVFEPDSAWQPETEYTIEVVGTGFLSTTKISSQSVSFLTKSLPTIVSASFTDDQADIAADGQLTVSLDQPLDNQQEFSFRLEPPVEIETTLDPSSQTYIIKGAKPFEQGQNYKLIGERQTALYSRSSQEIISRSEKEVVFERRFRIKQAPKIASFIPSGSSVLPTATTIAVQFTIPMQKEEVGRNISISPRLGGKWSWQNDQSIIFNMTEGLVKGTTYTVVIKAGTHAQDGSFIESDINLSFSTVGNLKVISVYPGKKSGISLSSPIKLTFDQPVDKTSAEQNFRVEPTLNGDFSWQDQTLVFQPKSELSYFTTYKITLAKGTKSIYGNDSAIDYVSNFTTAEKVVVLNVSWDRQDRALSCEAAALKMALSYKGVKVSEDDIMNLVGYDPTPRSGSVWGDPDVSFVGDINGSQNSTGYGVHWLPIARAANYYRNAKAFSGGTLSDLARELDNNNPIVVWGVMGSAHTDSWQTIAGKSISAWKGEHVRTVIGYRGSTDNPTSFVLNDPILGRINWSASVLRSNWSAFNYSGVVIY